MFPSAAFVPSKDLGSRPFSGTVTLYPSSDCKDLLSLGTRTVTIQEAECFDDTLLLGLGGFKSYTFTRMGDGKDATSSKNPEDPFTLVLQAFGTVTCAKVDGKGPSQKALNKDLSSSGCVNTNAGVLAKGFMFRRFFFTRTRLG